MQALYICNQSKNVNNVYNIQSSGKCPIQPSLRVRVKVGVRFRLRFIGGVGGWVGGLFLYCLRMHECTLGHSTFLGSNSKVMNCINCADIA